MNTRKIVKAVLALLFVFAPGAKAEDPVYFADANLKAAVEVELGITDPTPSDMLGLTFLGAGGRGIVNLTGLEYAENLTQLHLDHNLISDIGPLSGLTNLLFLELDDNSISDIWPLSGLTNLQELVLADNQINDISALAGLTNLWELVIHYNQISDISALSALTNLATLSLGANQIGDISALSGLTNLQGCMLCANQISDISALSGLTNLQALVLCENQISDISPLSALTNLNELVIFNNQISDISPLSALTNLQDVMLNDNYISDISALSGLTSLYILYLSDNDISDIQALVDNLGLDAGMVYISGNPLSYKAIYTDIPILDARGVTVYFDDRTPTTLVMVSGDGQTGEAGSALAEPFVVQVFDENSVPFEGVPVTFSVTAGGGSLDVETTTTDSVGRVESTLTLGLVPGLNTVQVVAAYIASPVAFDATAEPAQTTLSGVVYEDTNEDGQYTPGQDKELSYAVVQAQGVEDITDFEGRFQLRGLTGGFVEVSVEIDDEIFAYRFPEIEEGKNTQIEIAIPMTLIDRMFTCARDADYACEASLRGLVPFFGILEEVKALNQSACKMKEMQQLGDPFGMNVTKLQFGVSLLSFATSFIEATPIGFFVNLAIEGLITLDTCQGIDLYEFYYTNCEGNSGILECLRTGFERIAESIVAIATQSPVDIHVFDSQGNVMELDTDYITTNELSSLGWIFKGPDHEELALIFDAEDQYVVQITGTSEAGSGSTFFLEVMRQAPDGSQQILTYTNVPISAQGLAVTRIGEEIYPVLDVDVDGDTSNDLNLLPDSLAVEVIPKLPVPKKSIAGRRAPVEFSIRKPERIDPAMPFVHDENLEVRIYNTEEPQVILHTSTYGRKGTDYRIDATDEIYTTNFKTKKEPAEYIVEIWRPSVPFMVGSFNFETIK